MVAITEERKNSLERASSRSYKEETRETGNRKEERRIVEGKLQRHRGSHRGGKRDKLSRFFLSSRPPHGREYKQVSPGRISPRSTAAPIENLRQFRRASVCSKVGTRARESCGKMEGGGRRKGKKEGNGKREGRARCRSIPRENAFGVG